MAHSDKVAGNPIPAGGNREWHYHPALPIPTSAVFAWPFRPFAAVKWLASYWLAISTTVVECVIAITVYYYFLPDWAVMKTLSAGWIAQVYLRNLFLILLVAGGLHLYFYILGRQRNELKFDPRGMGRGKRIFLFNDQVKDNMFWSIASGVTLWTAYEVLYLWAAANTWVPMVTFDENPIWFVTWFVLIPIWSSLHFYWVHRWLHWPPLYKAVHALHHRNISVGPWSGISMHPVEHLIYYSTVLVHLVVASHPIHFLFHMFVQNLNPPFTHSGFEGIVIGGKKRFGTGDFFHQLHHRYFECNYGTAEMPWDKWFGSFHDGTNTWKNRNKDIVERLSAE